MGSLKVVCCSALALAAMAPPVGLRAKAIENAPANVSSDLKTQGYSQEDALFAKPFIDADEARMNNGVAYRYVHGGFEGTDTRFSYYFPEPWQGRFFQYITPVPDSEKLSQGLMGSEDRIGSAFAGGAYFIETNGGGPKAADPRGGLDPTIGAYRANAAAARFSRFIAAQVYGQRPRIYGYVYGGSGGAYRTLGALENTKGVWDGAVPYVLGSPMAIPNMFTVRLYAMRVLGEKLDGVVDALDAGGSGDPYAGLDEAQSAALREVTAMGFAPQSWYAWRTMGPHAFALLFGAVRAVDAGYFNDFWTKPGYEGHDHPSQYAKARIQFPTAIAQVITADDAERAGMQLDRSPGTAKGTADLAWKEMGVSFAGQRPVAVRLAQRPPAGALLLSDLVLPDGRKLVLSDVQGDLAIIGINDPHVIGSLKVGQTVQLDNSDILAVERYHTHQVPPNDGQYPVWDQFRDPEGNPKLPQRPMLLGPLFTRSASGALQTGQYDGKVILIENLWDREALPWQGDWYRRQVMAKAGADAENRFRIWYTDRALHGDTAQQDDPSRVVSYLGVLQQALLDLAAWVEKGEAPPASTAYKIVDGQVVVPTTVQDRRGIQPVVTLSANGGALARVKAGQPVRLEGVITVPPGTGQVVAAEWDFEGDGNFDETTGVHVSEKVHIKLTHSYAKPGTYFAVLRGTSQREGDTETAFQRIQTLARARIVVE
jgi:hypothetical protein